MNQPHSRAALLGAFAISSLLLTSCFRHRTTESIGQSLADAIETAYQFERHCCNPAHGLPHRLGQIQLRNRNAAGSDTKPVRVGIELPPELRAEVQELELAAGESATVGVDAVGCAYHHDNVSVVLTRDEQRRVDVVPVVNECAPNTPLAAALGLIDVPATLVAEFIRGYVITRTALAVPHSSRAVPPRLPLLRHTEIIAVGVFLHFFQLATLGAAFGDVGPASTITFPLGAGPNGYTLAAQIPAPMPEGNYVVAFLRADGEIPLGDTARRYQYAFVFDADGQPANNYRAAPDFPNDFFQGTDRWYEVDYQPATGWQLRVKRVDANNRVSEVGSAARVVIVKDGLLLLAPQNEFGVPRPASRMTAFAHEGDFGLRPPHTWSGDVEPPAAEGLRGF
jgi:hypothetical protein